MFPLTHTQARPAAAFGRICSPTSTQPLRHSLSVPYPTCAWAVVSCRVLSCLVLSCHARLRRDDDSTLASLGTSLPDPLPRALAVRLAEEAALLALVADLCDGHPLEALAAAPPVDVDVALVGPALGRAPAPLRYVLLVVVAEVVAEVVLAAERAVLPLAPLVVAVELVPRLFARVHLLLVAVQVGAPPEALRAAVEEAHKLPWLAIASSYVRRGLRSFKKVDVLVWRLTLKWEIGRSGLRDPNCDTLSQSNFE